MRRPRVQIQQPRVQIQQPRVQIQQLHVAIRRPRVAIHRPQEPIHQPHVAPHNRPEAVQQGRVIRYAPPGHLQQYKGVLQIQVETTHPLTVNPGPVLPRPITGVLQLLLKVQHRQDLTQHTADRAIVVRVRLAVPTHVPVVVPAEVPLPTAGQVAPAVAPTALQAEAVVLEAGHTAPQAEAVVQAVGHTAPQAEAVAQAADQAQVDQAAVQVVHHLQGDKQIIKPDSPRGSGFHYQKQ